MKRSQTVLALVATLSLCVPQPADARTLEWSGYEWWVRTSSGALQGPGPNIFSDSPDNVFVDDDGFLHLKITKRADGKWVAAEVDLTQSLGYGTYEWEVASRYDQWATNVVGGLFTYISPESVANQTDGAVGNGVPDTPHEIDIEFTKAWGNGHLYFTTHDPDIQSPSKNFYQALTGDYTTHRFKWEPTKITWNSYNGHVAGVENPPFPIVEQRPGAANGAPATHVYEGPVVPKDLNEVPIINFWLFGDDVANTGPSDGQPHELIIKSFKYTPLAVAPPVAGDFNGDGNVDANDYALWAQSYSQLGVVAADGNRDGVVDAADYTIWRDALAAQAAVLQAPEATNWSLAIAAILGRSAVSFGGRR